jgi:hypothetical protein
LCVVPQLSVASRLIVRGDQDEDPSRYQQGDPTGYSQALVHGTPPSFAFISPFQGEPFLEEALTISGTISRSPSTM